MSAITAEAVENQPQAPSFQVSKLALWLLVIGMGMLFLPLYLLSGAIKEENALLQAELDQLEMTLSTTPEPDPEEEKLSSELTDLFGQASTIQGLRSTVTSNHIDWPAVMDVFDDFDPASIQLTGLIQAEDRFSISGMAKIETAVTTYANQLRESSVFEQVIIQSISLRTEADGDWQVEFDLTVELTS